MVIITVYRYKQRPLPPDLYELLRDGRKWMPEDGLYDWYERNARLYWTEQHLREAKQQAFGLEFACIYRIEDVRQAKRLHDNLLHKGKGVQKAVPGAIAVQTVRRFEGGRRLIIRHQFGQLAYPSRAHRWCIVPAFGGIATESKTVKVVK